MSLVSILEGDSSHSLLIVQWSPDQGPVPLLRTLIQRTSAKYPNGQLMLVSFVHPPDVLVSQSSASSPQKILDFTSNIPGYHAIQEIDSEVLNAVNECRQSLTVVVDSTNTLVQNYDSQHSSLQFFRKLLAAILEYPTSHRRLVLFTESSCSLLPSLVSTSFNPNTAHLLIHHPSYFGYLLQNFMVSPVSEKTSDFWQIFDGFSNRGEGEKLTFGPKGEGGGSDEFVVEIIDRVRHARKRADTKKAVNRFLEGWNHKGPCQLRQLRCFSAAQKDNSTLKASSVAPGEGLSFNVLLTETQQRQRSQVPLPFAHQGAPAKPGVISYDPDSADDIDDDDPDEDLDI